MTLLMLIIALPHTTSVAASGYAHVHSDGQSVLRSATGAAATLSTHAGEVVAVVPYSRLSWLTVQLPPGSHGPRLAPVLQGLLEDRLLDEPEQLHIVPAPDVQATARAGGTTTVAVCDKLWLREALAPLQAAGLTVQRLVPELSPSDTPVLQVMGEPEQSHSVLTHEQGVTPLPPNTAQWHAFALLQDPQLQVQAESAMVTRVQSLLQRQARLQSAAQRWVQASQSTWDLAQGEWAQGRAQRLQRLLQAGWQTWRHAPAWRPVRWGVMTLLVMQVLGLNALAWRAQNDMSDQKKAIATVLTRTFPQVRWVVDAPLQMQRELEVLQRNAGRASRTDLEPLLATLAGLMPADQTPTQLHFVEHSLRVRGVNLGQATQHPSLKAQGLQLRPEGDGWLLQTEPRP